MVGSARKIGAANSPAIPDKAAPKAKATAMVRLTGMPTSRAVCRSCAVACIRIPNRVLVRKKYCSSRITARVAKMKS
nr:hypothetical protein [Bradyrhizobium sp.]